MIAQNSAGLRQDELIEVTKADVKNGMMRSTPLRAGKSYTRAMLTELALVSSDNVAAAALGRSAEYASAYASLVEPTGLSPQNTSSARELVKLAETLYKTDVALVSTRTSTEVGARHSTNPLLTKEGWSFSLSKTGFIKDAGGCLVVIVDVKDRPTIIVLLGAADTKQRWLDLAELRQRLGDSNFYVPVKVRIIKRKKHETTVKR